MNILFVHQSFPGQYLHIARALAAQGGHRLVALSIHEPDQPLPKGVTVVRYGPRRGNTADIQPLVMETETKVIRAEACASAAYRLKQQGFAPDLICAHPGWGEALFLRDVWPEAPLLCYQEFFYRADDSDCDFDLELQDPLNWEQRAKIRMKNANLLLTLEASSWNVTPTKYQRSTFPSCWQSQISAIHDGIRTDLARPEPQTPPLILPDGTELRQGQPIVTFVNRRLEPYRGCHTFLRSIPDIQERQPEARIVIVGALQGVSYGKKCPSGEWKDVFIREIKGKYDPHRVHFTGPLPYQTFLQLLRLSAAHVYLTYPFVMSWSLLEAMSTGCAVVGSATAPVQEVIEHGRNGLLVDFFSSRQLADAVTELLNNRTLADELGTAARETVVQQYSLQQCLPRQLSLIDLVAGGALHR